MPSRSSQTSGPAPAGPTASPLVEAVIPAAGLGTRFLPATRAIPKEMLPVVDKPAIQYVVGDQPFAVLLEDDLIDPRDHLLEQMIAVRTQRGGSVVALREVPPEQTNLYGCAAAEETDDEQDVVRVTGLVEKPAPADAPSNLASSR